MKFSRVDAVAAGGVAVLLGVWFGSGHLGERGRIGWCARNLGVLGQAMDSYANEHYDSIPAAGIHIGEVKVSWDTALLPYLKPAVAKTQSAYEKRLLLDRLQPLLLCPSDPVPRGRARSYAMAGRDMALGWPPEPQDKTGVGVFWGSDAAEVLAEPEAEQSAKDSEALPKLKRSVLAQPAGTLLLTELMSRNNSMGSLLDVRLFGVPEQDKVLAQAPRVHRRRFNYLMADGHVERMTGFQTGGTGGKASPAGIWTVKAGD